MSLPVPFPLPRSLPRPSVRRWVPPANPTLEIEPRISTAYILAHKVEVFDDTGNPVTEWFSTRAMITGPSDEPPSTTFRELINDPGTFKTQAFGQNGRTAGLVAPVWGTLEWQNTAGDFDLWMEYATDGGRVTCYYGPFGGVFPGEFRKVFIAYIDGQPTFSPTGDGGHVVKIALRGRERLFDKRVVTRGFTDDSGTENGVDLETAGLPGSRLQFLVMGTPGFYAPILLNDTQNILQIAGNTWNGSTLPRLFDGGNELVYAGGIAPGGVGGGGSFGLLIRPNGPVFAQLTTEARVEVRAWMVGYYATPTVTARRWTICDLATMAGITGVDPNSMPDGSVVFDAGNRLVETQSFKEVLNDIAAFEVALISMDRLDRFYAKRIEPSFMGTPVFTFRDSGTYSDGNARGLTWAPIPGMEKRVWQVAVSAGETHRSALSGVVTDAIKDALSRDPWTTRFVVNCTYNSGPPYYRASTILDADPTAVLEEVQIVGNEFPSQTEMDAWALRYMRLHGAKTVAFWIEVDLTYETLALNLLDAVILQTARFGGAREAIIWAIDVQLGRRIIRFGCWSHREDDAPTGSELSTDLVNDTVGAGGSGAGAGTGGKGASAPPIESFVVTCSDKTSAITTGTNKQHFFVPYDFYLMEVQGGLDTPQTSGSLLTLDVNDGASSVLSTKITFDNNEATSLTAAAQPVISDHVLLKGTKVTFDVDQAGTGGKGWSVTLIGYQLT